MKKSPEFEQNQNNTHPKIGFYEHFKGGIYIVEGVAEHTETDELVVVYRSHEEQDKIYVRPLENFMQEIETPNGKLPRFSYIGQHY